MTEQELKQKVFEALDNPKYKWRTIGGISRETGIAFETVYYTVYKYRDEVVGSAVSSDTNEPLFTTRENWFRHATWLDKIRAGFRNSLG